MNNFGNTCRIAFNGKVIQPFEQENIPNLKIYRSKMKYSDIERVLDENSCISKNLFSKGVNMNNFVDRVVHLVKKDNGEVIAEGKISGAFGKAGKYNVNFENNVFEEVKEIEQYHISFPIKRYVFDTTRTLRQ